MSKSRGNVVNPDEQVEKFGADAVRLYINFLGPHDKGGAWKTEVIEGSYRFLNRVWNLINTYKDSIVKEEKDARSILSMQHQTIKRVSKDIEALHTHTAIAALMEFVNFLEDIVKKSNDQKPKTKSQIRCAEWDEAMRTLIQLLAPFAPHMAEELWAEILGEEFSVHKSIWPKFDPSVIKEDVVTIVVQVNGKMRGILEVESEKLEMEEEIVKMAKENEKISKWLKGKKIKKEIVVPGKLVNFVI
jgi:leucyl-tRNA synthetase